MAERSGRAPAGRTPAAGEDQAARRRRAARLCRTLARAHPDARCWLDFRSPFELLAATILAAQCTDLRVNATTPALFRRYPDAAALARADPAELEALIRPTGFFRNKAKSLLACAAALVSRHGGAVPDTMAELTALGGVGRKTANVLLGTCFGQPAIIVDTHMVRVANRLGLTAASDPERIERDLQALLPPARWTQFSHLVTTHGRRVCAARRPRCPECPARGDCPWPEKTPAPETGG